MGFLWSQLFVTPAYPKESFSGKTVIVTGSNVGLGFEAARHFARLGAKKLILAVRNLEAGEKAKQDIEASTKRSGFCEVWSLDLANYESVKAFAKRANQLDRVDVLVENAGIVARTFRKSEGHESSIAVNVISTFLLALLMLPKLEETAQKFNIRPHLVIVSSEVHGWAKFPERDLPKIFDALDDEERYDVEDRYPVSKLLEVLAIRQIAPKIATGKNKHVILNMLNPGLCHSGLAREIDSWGFYMMKLVLARTTEVGSRTLVAAASVGPQSHGKYMTDAMVADEEVVPWVRTPEGDRVGEQVWSELSAILENIEPGVTDSVN